MPELYSFLFKASQKIAHFHYSIGMVMHPSFYRIRFHRMKANAIAIFLLAANISWGQCDDFEMTIDVMDPTCMGYSDGAITINVTGGNGGYEFTITDEDGTVVNVAGGTPNVLPFGWYYCYVEDDSGCVLYDSVYLDDPDPVEAVVILTQPTALGSCDGLAEVDTVLGYQGSFSGLLYFWSAGGPAGLGETIKSDLCDEFYTLTINDEWGCTGVFDFAMGSAEISTSANHPMLLCFPNPFNDFTHISTGNSIQPANLSIYDLTGRCLRTETTEGTNYLLERGDLNPGIYRLVVGNLSSTLIVAE